MKSKTRKRLNPFADWDDLAREFPERITEAQASIYSLPSKLIDLIDTEVGIFTEDDREFEHVHCPL